MVSFDLPNKKNCTRNKIKAQMIAKSKKYSNTGKKKWDVTYDKADL